MAIAHRARCGIEAVRAGLYRLRPPTERRGLVAEIARNRAGRGEVLAARRRFEALSLGPGERAADCQHAGQSKPPKTPLLNRATDTAAACHRLPSFQSVKLIRSIRNRSVVRAYQPRPCIRPIRRIFSVAT